MLRIIGTIKNRVRLPIHRLCTYCQIFVVGLFLAVYAQCSDNIAIAKAAVIDFYPELKGQDLHIGISDGGLLDVQGPLSNFTIVIQHPLHPGLPAGQCPVPLLAVDFTFAVKEADHYLFLFGAGGPFVNEEKIKEITDQVDSHTEWSDDEAASALIKAGARFGPSAKKELLDKLPIQGLKTLLGGDVVVESADFKIRDAAQFREHLPAASLSWIVSIRVHNAKRETKYMIFLEPFDGKIVFIEKSPPIA
jgi:hypothetical protein